MDKEDEETIWEKIILKENWRGKKNSPVKKKTVKNDH